MIIIFGMCVMMKALTNPVVIISQWCMYLKQCFMSIVSFFFNFILFLNFT